MRKISKILWWLAKNTMMKELGTAHHNDASSTGYLITVILLLSPPHLSSSSLRSSNCNNFLISFARTEQSANSFILRTIKLWNNLPVETQSCTDFRLFKQLILPLFL